jgi:Flp pilus assembly protein TadG
MTGFCLRRVAVAVACRSGSAAVEMAIVLPVVMLFLFGLTEFGRAIWTQATLDYAVESAARCAAISATCATTALTQTYAVSRSAGLTVLPSVFTVTTPTCGKQVTATLPFQFAVPKLLPYVLTLTSSACYPS